jgi:hypothetical protein
LDGDGKPETAFIGPEERLYLIDDDGTLLWQSREYYGATANILEGKDPTSGSTRVAGGGGATDDDEVETYYIPSPLILVDLNSDNQLELLANRNVSLASRVLSRQRNFSDGEIQSLAWVGDNILPQWKTRLVAAAVLQRGTFKKTKSMIYVYDLDRVRALSGKTSAPGIIESNM